jgi:hypothetical protein
MVWINSSNDSDFRYVTMFIYSFKAVRDCETESNICEVFHSEVSSSPVLAGSLERLVWLRIPISNPSTSIWLNLRWNLLANKYNL